MATRYIVIVWQCVTYKTMPITKCTARNKIKHLAVMAMIMCEHYFINVFILYSSFVCIIFVLSFVA